MGWATPLPDEGLPLVSLKSGRLEIVDVDQVRVLRVSAFPGEARSEALSSKRHDGDSALNRLQRP